MLELLKKVEEVDFCGLEKEIILIDDFSTDGTRDLYPQIPHKVLYHDENLGKGAALRTGLKEATGDIIIIQDADLEYNPKAQYMENVKGEIKIVKKAILQDFSKAIPFDKILMSDRTPAGKRNPGKTMGELLTPKQKPPF